MISFTKRDFVWMIPLVLVLLVGFGLALNSGDYLVHGHDAGELNISAGGGSVPSGAVMAFNLAACPTGWSFANGSDGTPDLRGQFIRGLDLGAGVDTGRTLASFQDDSFKSHDHMIYIGQNSGTNHDGAANRGWDLVSNKNADSNNRNNIGHEGSTETRPKNVALTYCVKD